MGLQIVAFFGLLALIPTAMAINDWRVWYMLWRYGVLAEARIQYHWEAPIGLFRHYYIIYEFDAQDENGDALSFNRYTEIEREEYFMMLAGEPLMVRYSWKNPAIFRLNSQSTSHIRWTLGAVVFWFYVAFMGYVAL